MAAVDIFPKAAGTFTRYTVELQVQNGLVGGIPKDPDVIRKWLEARLDMEDPALVELAEKTYAEMKGEDAAEPTAAEITDALARNFEGGNGFKSINGELVYEGRCMKAALKEAANIAYPNKTPYPGRDAQLKASGLKSKLAERVFVVEQYIGLGVSEPTIENEQRIKHVKTPQGPRSAINVVDIVERPLLKFHVDVLDDCYPPELWARLWSALEKNGIGSDRARGDGTCELVRWEK